MTFQEQLTVHQKYRFSVSDFLLLARSGAFEDYARTELIEGEIWAVNAVHSRHARVHAQLIGELVAALKAIGSTLQVYTTPSTQLAGASLPEPDIALAEPNDAPMLPGANVRLAVEISDTTLDMDLHRKAGLYAVNGIPEYWVADVEGRVIHQLWAPEAEHYSERREVKFGERIAAATVAGLAVDTSRD